MDLGFAVIPDATTNAPADEVDYLQENGRHQGTDGSCGLTVSLMEAGYEHDSVMLDMTVDNIPEERPDYTFTSEIDFELVSIVLPGTLVPSNVEVRNTDDGAASQNGALYDHGHSVEVCFTTDDYADSGCYYTAMLVDPPSPGTGVSVQGQVVISDTTSNVVTSLTVETCDTPTMAGDTNNQATCVADGSRVASLNGATRDGARVTPYTYDDTHSETLEQTNNGNDERVYDDRPIRVSFGAAGSVPSFAPSLMAVGLVGLFAAALINSSRREEEEEELVENETAVSPVIATILMVAITVVLSGVIYVWANQLASTSTKVTPLLTFDADAITMDDGTMYWQIVVTTAETPLALQALYVQVEFINDQCPDGYCIITQTIAEPQSYGFTPYNSDSFVTYLDSIDCSVGEGTDGCVAEFSASDVLRINFVHPTYGLIDEAIIQIAYATGNEAHVLAEFDAQSNPPGIK